MRYAKIHQMERRPRDELIGSGFGQKQIGIVVGLVVLTGLIAGIVVATLPDDEVAVVSSDLNRTAIVDRIDEMRRKFGSGGIAAQNVDFTDFYNIEWPVPCTPDDTAEDDNFCKVDKPLCIASNFEATTDPNDRIFRYLNRDLVKHVESTYFDQIAPGFMRKYKDGCAATNTSNYTFVYDFQPDFVDVVSIMLAIASGVTEGTAIPFTDRLTMYLILREYYRTLLVLYSTDDFTDAEPMLCQDIVITTSYSDYLAGLGAVGLLEAIIPLMDTLDSFIGTNVTDHVAAVDYSLPSNPTDLLMSWARDYYGACHKPGEDYGKHALDPDDMDPPYVPLCSHLNTTTEHVLDQGWIDGLTAVWATNHQMIADDIDKINTCLENL